MHSNGFFNNIGQSNQKVLLTGLVLFLPLVFINLNAPHNWGDDFAQYLMHSQKLAGLENPYQINYVYNSHYAVMSPPAYPMGFPLLLSPVSWFRPGSLLVYKIYMQLLLLLLVSFNLLFLAKYLKLQTAIIALMVVFYSPLLIAFKGQILSDIPFALFFLLACYEAENKKNIFLLSFYITCCLAIRSAGIALMPGLIILLYTNLFRNTSNKLRSISIAIGILIFPLTIIILNQLTSNIGYRDQLGGNILHALTINLQRQIAALNDFFFAGFSSTLVYSFTYFILPLVSLIGLVQLASKKHVFIITALFSYEALILLFPYENGAIRFTIPILPLFILLLFTGTRKIFNFLRLKSSVKYGAVAVFIITTLCLSVPANIVTSRKLYRIDSPESPEAKEIFSFILQNTQPDQTFIFIKPKALAFFAGRKCVANNPSHGQTELGELIEKFHCSYAVTYNKIINEPLNDFVQFHKTTCPLLYDKNGFRIYQLGSR